MQWKFLASLDGFNRQLCAASAVPSNSGSPPSLPYSPELLVTACTGLQCCAVYVQPLALLRSGPAWLTASGVLNFAEHVSFKQNHARCCLGLKW